MELTSAMQKFITHWGEMGTRWGVNRTVAQIHALLIIHEKPLDAETIADVLKVARSHAGSSLKELQSWGLVEPIRILGERREYFQAEKDVLEIAKLVAQGRKVREIDPTVKVLQQCLEGIGEDNDAQYARLKIEEILNFTELTLELYNISNKLPLQKIIKLKKMIKKIL